MIRWMLICCLAVPCWATNFYVDAARPDDSGDGTTEATAEKTIQAGIADVAAAGAGTHKLYVKAGSYAGTNYSLNALADATHITIEGYSATPGDGEGVQLASRPVLASTATDYCFFRSGNWTGSSLTLTNLDVGPPSLINQALIRWGSALGNAPVVGLTARYCRFTAPASSTSGILQALSTAGGGTARPFAFHDCQFVGHATTSYGLAVYEAGTVTLDTVTVTPSFTTAVVWAINTIQGLDIQDCVFGDQKAVVSFNAPSTAGASSFVWRRNTGAINGSLLNYGYAPATDPGTLVFEDNTFTCNGYGIAVGCAYTNLAFSTYWRQAKIVGNTITRTGSNSGHPLMLGLNVDGADVCANRFTGLPLLASAEFGAVLKGSHISFERNACHGRYAIYVTSGRANRVVHNTAYGTATFAFCWNVNENTAVPGGTGANAVTNGTATVAVAGSDLSKVRVGDLLQIVGRTDGVDATAFFEITAVDDGADTVSVTPSPGAAAAQTWYAYAPQVKDLIVTDNVFYGAGCPAVGDLSGMHGRILMDRNRYYVSSGALAWVEGSCADLAALQARWGAGDWDDSFAGNDENSVEGDPGFVDGPGGDLRLKADSAVIEQQDADSPSLMQWNDRGAWQRGQARVSPTRRGEQ